ncbi:MAG: GAF domain-containing protein [candidate division Zixibacteria bacterium]|jgi:transcriptional regulator with GAF, ATPase, and Fis domain|nr:GAF domain-containing protein [candidate division Zixibacteria bacterium]NIR66180.1 GAF domain-containing protein [candidate division Zixibacteria bacterium]NIS17260.1 GAF domain-containing protein [candidate division Zixibacteria bacterium]NIS47803.1 GAF domain-containing protein [candidate division Zixibacteria bacterium]NIT53617.1 GAF domain-containing protein [candidate division Zixibacteria bacterium]
MSEIKWMTDNSARPTEIEFRRIDRSELQAESSAYAENSVFRSLKKVINSSYTRYELFMKLCSKLDKFFAINRASLALYDEENDLMSITHVQINREFRNGVHLNVVAGKTLMKKVLDSGHVYVRDYSQDIEAIELEKKILMDKNSKSLAIIPLVHGNKKIGTLNITSSSYQAFSILESHIFDYFFHKTSEKMSELPQ